MANKNSRFSLPASRFILGHVSDHLPHVVKRRSFMTWHTLTIFFLAILITACLLLFGCASSNVQREAAANVDMGVHNAKDLVDDMSESSAAESYQNASQAAKGGLIGGTAGAVTGLFASGVGVIPGMATGAIFGSSYGLYIDQQSSLGDRLSNRGAKVIELGDQIIIVMPSARIFKERTPDIRPQAYSTLDLLSEYINQRMNMLVKVTAYTNSVVSPEVDLALTQQQADSVVKYLSRHGTDTRLLVANGEGTANPIERESIDWRTSQNYRIEVTLEKLHA